MDLKKSVPTYLTESQKLGDLLDIDEKIKMIKTRYCEDHKTNPIIKVLTLPLSAKNHVFYCNECIIDNAELISQNQDQLQSVDDFLKQVDEKYKQRKIATRNSHQFHDNQVDQDVYNLTYFRDTHIHQYLQYLGEQQKHIIEDFKKISELMAMQLEQMEQSLLKSLDAHFITVESSLTKFRWEIMEKYNFDWELQDNPVDQIIENYADQQSQKLNDITRRTINFLFQQEGPTAPKISDRDFEIRTSQQLKELLANPPTYQPDLDIFQNFRKNMADSLSQLQEEIKSMVFNKPFKPSVRVTNQVMSTQPHPATLKEVERKEQIGRVDVKPSTPMISALKISQDSKCLFMNGEKQNWFIKDTPWLFNTNHTGQLNCVAGVESGIIATGATDCLVKMWDIESGNLISTFKAHKGPVISLATFRFKKGTQSHLYLISGSTDRFAILWDVHDKSNSIVLKGQMGSVTTILSLEDYRNIVTGSSEKQIYIWDIHEGKISNSFMTKGSVIQLQKISFDRFASSDSSRSLIIWHIQYEFQYKVKQVTQEKLLNSNSFVSALLSNSSLNETIFGGTSEGNLQIWSQKIFDQMASNFQKLNDSEVLELSMIYQNADHYCIASCSKGQSGLFINTCLNGKYSTYEMELPQFEIYESFTDQQMQFIQSQSGYQLLMINQHPLHINLFVFEIEIK